MYNTNFKNYTMNEIKKQFYLSKIFLNIICIMYKRYI